MARNEVLRDGDHISLPVTADTPEGSPVIVGSIVGVAQTAEGEGGNPDGYASVLTKGVHEFTVTGAFASYGLPVYITSAYALTATSSGNTLFGYSMGTKGSGSGLLNVKIARV